MILEASFQKDIENINSQEDLLKVLQKALKNNIEVKFDMPFMSKEDFDSLNEKYGMLIWRYSPGFKYENFYKDYGIGTLKRIDSKKYIIINPESKNFVTDTKLTITELYRDLVYSDDFMMFIDNKQVSFHTNSGSAESLNKEVSNINSLEEFVKVLKKCDKSQITVNFDMPFAKKDYLEALKNVDSYTRIRMQMDPKVREEYEEYGLGTMKYITLNKYVYIEPTNKNLIGDQRLSFNTLYDNLLKYPEDYKMIIDNKEISFDTMKENIMSETTDFNGIASKAIDKFKSKNTKTEEPKEEKVSDTKKKFVIELSFNYDGDSDLADCIQDQLGKKAEVNEVLRTRRIMEFDFKNKSMFDAAMKTITDTMKEKGKTDYKLDSRIDDDVETPVEEGLEEVMEEINLMISENKYPVKVTSPYLIESLKWASKSRPTEKELLEFVLKSITSYKDGVILDV